MKQKRKKNLSGFTLVETLIAILIFALISVLIAGSFSGFLKNYMTIKRSQRSIENAQYVMNLMAKTLRTSDVEVSVSGSQTFIKALDFSQSKCLVYKYDSTARKITQAASNTLTPPFDSFATDCVTWFGGSPTYTDFSDDSIVSLNVFPAPPTTITDKITLVAQIKDAKDTSTIPAIPIQMTVALRN